MHIFTMCVLLCRSHFVVVNSIQAGLGTRSFSLQLTSGIILFCRAHLRVGGR